MKPAGSSHEKDLQETPSRNTMPYFQYSYPHYSYPYCLDHFGQIEKHQSTKKKKLEHTPSFFHLSSVLLCVMPLLTPVLLQQLATQANTPKRPFPHLRAIQPPHRLDAVLLPT